ncbi:MAG TPA: MFS transporter [Oscillatoriaceae cyanobacterium M33_DOE_052]|uniref:MFS transporter n=1 Tax=Planktothricoides sp. SpSt-374 TaxID=2282167 RepID=A0A7C3ZM08_9CYAN|nr:MFS transporter [Oscillatoriaceae cyanobacterium M33_DOE_052]
MELKDRQLAKSGWVLKILQWLNLRPDEAGRTGLMFAFYTATSVGLLWLEASAVGLLLGEYGAASLPWIYIAGAVLGSALGFLYSWLQKIMSLRRTIVAIAILIPTPLVLFRFGLENQAIFLYGVTVFILRLWVESIYILNDLNTAIAANQLFNIREIKRTYPIISSGILLADVVSGFSLPFLLDLFGLANVTIAAAVMFSVGAGLLYYLSERYKQAFPDSRSEFGEDEEARFINKRLQGQQRSYVVPLIAFFLLSPILYLLIDFQFLSALESQNLSGENIASFIGVFNGVLGICEVLLQWFAASRLIERFGVFASATFLPMGIGGVGMLIIGLAIFSLNSFSETKYAFFAGIVALKFWDELFHYTLSEATGPVLFQPLPDANRNSLQSLIGGVLKPLCNGVTGLAMVGIIWVCRWALPEAPEAKIQELQDWLFLCLILVMALMWLVVINIIRSQYVRLLVSSAESGRLGVSDVDIKTFKRTVVETLQQPGKEDDKRSCIELLAQIDKANVSEELAPLLMELSPALQRQSLEIMVQHPVKAYVNQVRSLVNQTSNPEVMALALRYIWMVEPEQEIEQLRPYLQPEVDPVVRGTAAALILRRGNREQKAEATNTLRRMVTHKQEWERVMGCRALGEADYLQGLRLYIPNLLQDESLRVRCALLEVISSTHLEEYYPSLLRGLYYKSTREAARASLVRLGNEVLSRVVALAEDIHKPDLVRMHAWSALGEMSTPEAIDVLVVRLMTAWGTTRRNILRVLLKIPQEAGIERVLDVLGRSGVEELIEQELMFMGQIYAALVDLADPQVSFPEANMLRSAMSDLLLDGTDRLFLLMKFLYPIERIQAATFNLQSGQRTNMARGLEILDNTLDIPSKRVLLAVLDRQSDEEKLQSLSEICHIEGMTPQRRVRHLLELRHFLSDWPLACCFHLARSARWSLTADQILACLRHPKGFVREAVLAYLKVASPRALTELLPMMKNDPDRLVAAQVRQMMEQLGVSDSTPARSATAIKDSSLSNYPGIAGFEAN